MKRYDYCCKSCWHTWRSEKKYTKCPKCKSENLDIWGTSKECKSENLDIQTELII